MPEITFCFTLNDSTQIQLNNAKTRDFYVLLNRKIHTVRQTGPMNWNSITRLDENAWKKIFTSLKSICKETKLKKFQFKLIHRIVVTKKELHRYDIKADDECLYCGEKDSIDHTFLNCRFVKIFVNNVIDWFNAANNSKFAPTIEEKLFGIISGPYEKEILRKFNYTILFMKYYIYTSKMHSQGIYLSIFVNKVLFKYRIKSFSKNAPRKNAKPYKLVVNVTYKRFVNFSWYMIVVVLPVVQETNKVLKFEKKKNELLR